MAISEFVVLDQPMNCCQLQTPELLACVKIEVGLYRYRRMLKNRSVDRFVVDISAKIVDICGQTFYVLSPISVSRPEKNGCDETDSVASVAENRM